MQIEQRVDSGFQDKKKGAWRELKENTLKKLFNIVQLELTN